MTLQRQIFNNLKSALSDKKILIIAGPRYVGKHFLMNQLINYLKTERQVPENRIFVFRFDDILTQIDFKDDLEAFTAEIETTLGEKLANTPEPVYLFFEEVQHYLAIFNLLAGFTQLHPTRIKIILTSSIDLEGHKSFQKLLASQSQLFRLYPLGLNELVGNNIAPSNDESVLHAILEGRFDLEFFEDIHWIFEPYKDAILNNIKDYALFGGLPAIFQHQDYQLRWQEIKKCIRQYFERELRIIYQIADLQKFNNIIKIFAANNGKILNLLNLCDYYHFNRNTIRKYTGIMHDTFVIDFVNPYQEEKISKPIMRTPKVYFLNTGLVNYFTEMTQYDELEKSEYFSYCLESMLYLNLKNTMEAYQYKFNISFLRDYQEHELDFLISTPDQLIPIGITFNHEARKMKVKTFRYYLRYCKEISNGVVFGNFDRIERLEMRGSRLFLLPLWMLW